MHRSALRLRFLVLLVVLLLGGPPGGCATARRPEPGQVVLRNATSRAVASMAVQEASEASLAPVRLGQVAPLPAGAQTVFRRADDPPALPDAALVRWRMGAGPDQVVRVDLGPLLRTATGRPGEALVFELRPDGRVAVLLEPFVP